MKDVIRYIFVAAASLRKSRKLKMKGKVVRPGGLELPTFWFVAEQGQNLSACSGVAYGPADDALTPTQRDRNET